MKLAVSSLPWDPQDDSRVRELLAQRDVHGVELAPLKLWPDPLTADLRAVAEYALPWRDAGIDVVSLQAILFGFPELQLFGSDAQQAALERHLAAIARIAAALQAPVVVLGAPKNRLRGAMSEDEAVERIVPFLRRVAESAHEAGTSLCIEPNPPRYGGDFVRDINEAHALVRAVDHPGFGLHLDAGAIAIEKELDSTVVAAARIARHFHVSEVDLAPIGSGSVDHARCAALLRAASYSNWYSIEMRSPPGGGLIETLDDAISVALAEYAAPVSATSRSPASG